MTARRALWALIGLSTVVRLAWAASLGAYTNEAYYFMYARHLDWSYFDHPPMVGLVSAAGLAIGGWIAPAFGLRLGYIALFAGSTWLLARITERAFNARAAVLAALAMNATLFFGVMAGTLAEPDGPLLFFWLLTLDRLMVALDDPERIWPWAGVGLAWGAALLSKYHAVLLPAGVLLLLVIRPSARRCLRTPGPYLSAVLGVLVFSPVIAWNAAHGWTSFLYQGTRAKGFQGFRPEFLLEAIVGQVLYLTPWIWAGLVFVLVRLLRRRFRDWSAAEAFLITQAIPALVLFMGVSTFRRIMVHWPLVGFIALLPMLGQFCEECLAARPRQTRRWLVAATVFPVLLATVFIVHARSGLLQDGRGRLLGLFAPGADPTVDTIRWEQIANQLEKRGVLDDPSTFMFTDYWRFSAELEMAMGRKASVACFHRDARSYTYWSRPEEWVGRDGIFISVADSLVPVKNYAPWFTRVEPLGSFPIMRQGVALETVHLYRCVRQTDPFPFGYLRDGPLPRPIRRAELTPTAN